MSLLVGTKTGLRLVPLEAFVHRELRAALGSLAHDRRVSRRIIVRDLLMVGLAHQAPSMAETVPCEGPGCWCEE